MLEVIKDKLKEKHGVSHILEIVVIVGVTALICAVILPNLSERLNSRSDKMVDVFKGADTVTSYE